MKKVQMSFQLIILLQNIDVNAIWIKDDRQWLCPLV